jgi:general secretion pathway protein I
MGFRKDRSNRDRARAGRVERAGSRGFSLLEVMVAIAILGLGLTAILSAQAGAFSAAQQARSLSVATGLARCKMLEVEEKLLRDGFPELDEQDSGPCCDGDDSELMRCTWRIDKPELPAAKLGDLDLNTDLNLSGSPGGGAPGIGALAGLGGPSGSLSSAVGSDAKAGDVAQGIAGTLADSGGMEGLIGMAMSLIYPDLKRFFEAGTRKITVNVHWADGSIDRTLEIMQWYTRPAPPTALPLPTGTGTGGGPPPPAGGR